MRILLAMVMLAGCGAAVDEAGTEAALHGGCKSVCPKCKTGQMCPMIACYLECNAPTPCGPTKCGSGQYCCNESCGICAAPGEMCTDLYCDPVQHGNTCVQTQLCIIGYHWSEAKCKCLSDTPTHGKSSCTTDADCRLADDYCTSCACDALSVNDPDPACSGPGVRCLVEPCAGHTAVCLNGSCSVN
jgi:hypothetical protein